MASTKGGQMPTLLKQKWVRIEKCSVAVILGIVAFTILTVLKSLLARKLGLMQFSETLWVPTAISLLNPIYILLCVLVGYSVGRYVGTLWLKPYTTEKDEVNEKN
jgi:hypothetical protein